MRTTNSNVIIVSRINQERITGDLAFEVERNGVVKKIVLNCDLRNLKHLKICLGAVAIYLPF